MRLKPSETVLEFAHKTANQTSPKQPLCHILVIDDDYVVRDLMLHILSTNYRVDALSSGVHLPEFLETHKPDLVILDIMLPWINGFNLCSILRSHSDTKETPILFLSGRILSEKDKVQGRHVGADGYLRKPFRREDLLKEVERLLHR